MLKPKAPFGSQGTAPESLRAAERIVRKGYRAPGRTPPRALRPGRQKAPPGGGSLHPGGGAVSALALPAPLPAPDWGGGAPQLGLGVEP
ncbi:uncharacterized protein [Alexandromys fortis]|uniref:uncharacterized protein isoform X3 n=1 Tax=Alexandromys fortis TaxID=100897 RepID=UPI0021535E78|nr:uncharacterized protein LOC126490687 isoform X3 [Microtus fortis]